MGFLLFNQLKTILITLLGCYRELCINTYKTCFKLSHGIDFSYYVVLSKLNVTWIEFNGLSVQFSCLIILLFPESCYSFSFLFIGLVNLIFGHFHRLIVSLQRFCRVCLWNPSWKLTLNASDFNSKCFSLIYYISNNKFV